MEDEKSEFARIRTVLTDLCYLLKVPLERNQFNPKITANFYKGLEEFVKSLSYLQVKEYLPHGIFILVR